MGMLNEVKSKNKIKAAQNWLKLAENAKTPEKQVEYYTKALDANPYNAEAWFRKGRVLERMGNFEEAQRCFDLATEIDPDYQGLIGKKQYNAEPAADYPESSVFPENQTEDTFMESELEEELAGEAVEEFMEEPGETFEGEAQEQAGKESIAEETGWSGSGYRPPVGEESIFSNLGRRENEEAVRDPEMVRSDPTSGDMQLVQETEITPREETAYESVLQADAGPATKAEAGGTGIVQSGSQGTDFWKEGAAASVKEAQPGSVNAGERSLKTGPAEKKPRPMKQPVAKGPEEAGLQGQFRETQPVASVTKEDMQVMDVRIPMSETLKFWAVGIVAVIIALKVATYI